MIRKILKFIPDVGLAAALIIAVTIVVPNLLGINTLAVLSGSMEKEIMTGSMVFVQPVEPESIGAGDVISFVLNEQGTLATHRVVEHDTENQRFVTKGDANSKNDPSPVLYENVIGVVQLTIPYLGYILGFVLTLRGKIIAGTAIAALIILMMIQEEPKSGRKKSEKEAHEDVKEVS